LFFKNGHISGTLAELIRSTRAPTKDRLIGKIIGGNPAFRGTRVPVHMLAELVPSRACARTRYRRGSVWDAGRLRRFNAVFAEVYRRLNFPRIARAHYARARARGDVAGGSGLPGVW